VETEKIAFKKAKANVLAKQPV